MQINQSTILLGQNTFDQFPVHIRKANVSALKRIGELFVINAEQMKHSRVQIRDGGLVFYNPVAVIVCLAIHCSGLDLLFSEMQHPNQFLAIPKRLRLQNITSERLNICRNYPYYP